MIMVRIPICIVMLNGFTYSLQHDSNYQWMKIRETKLRLSCQNKLIRTLTTNQHKIMEHVKYLFSKKLSIKGNNSYNELSDNCNSTENR